jgi:hypothetical protein
MSRLDVGLWCEQLVRHRRLGLVVGGGSDRFHLGVTLRLRNRAHAGTKRSRSGIVRGGRNRRCIRSAGTRAVKLGVAIG